MHEMHESNLISHPPISMEITAICTQLDKQSTLWNCTECHIPVKTVGYIIRMHSAFHDTSYNSIRMANPYNLEPYS